MRARIIVPGIGNRLMGDDGFGPRVIDLLEYTDLADEVELRDASTAGITIATYLADYEVAVFIDSKEMEGPPGTISIERLEARAHTFE